MTAGNCACSGHVGGAWAAQQARNLAWQLQEAKVKPRFLIHDRDANFPAGFDAVNRMRRLASSKKNRR